MANPFDVAREMARQLEDQSRSSKECAAQLFRMFPTGTRTDIRRALRILTDRLEMLEEERHAAAREFAEKWYSSAGEQVIDMAAKLYLLDVKLSASAETLFPNPDKTKS